MKVYKCVIAEIKYLIANKYIFYILKQSSWYINYFVLRLFYRHLNLVIMLSIYSQSMQKAKIVQIKS